MNLHCGLPSHAVIMARERRADLRDEDWRGPCCIARDVTRPARLVQRVVLVLFDAPNAP